MKNRKYLLGGTLFVLCALLFGWVVGKAGCQCMETEPKVEVRVCGNKLMPMIPGSMWVYLGYVGRENVNLKILLLFSKEQVGELLKLVSVGEDYSAIAKKMRLRGWEKGCKDELMVFLDIFGTGTVVSSKLMNIQGPRVNIFLVGEKGGWKEIGEEELKILNQKWGKKIGIEIVSSIPPWLVRGDVPLEPLGREVCIEGIRFNDCMWRKGRRVWELYGRGIGLVGLYFDRDFSERHRDDRRFKRYMREFPWLIRVCRVIYYYIPGEEPVEFMDERWLRKDGDGRLILKKRGFWGEWRM